MDVVHIEDTVDKSNGYLLIFFQIIAAIGAVFVVWNYVSEGKVLLGMVSFIWEIFSIWILLPLILKLSNKARLIMMPSMVVTGGFGETLSKKIFWTWGPQLFSLFWGVIFCVALLPGLVDDEIYKKSKPLQTLTPDPKPVAADKELPVVHDSDKNDVAESKPSDDLKSLQGLTADKASESQDSKAESK